MVVSVKLQFGIFMQCTFNTNIHTSTKLTAHPLFLLASDFSRLADSQYARKRGFFCFLCFFVLGRRDESRYRRILMHVCKRNTQILNQFETLITSKRSPISRLKQTTASAGPKIIANEKCNCGEVKLT